MFMHSFIKYTVGFGYIANYLTKIDDINLHFPPKNMISSKHLTYLLGVLAFIVITKTRLFKYIENFTTKKGKFSYEKV